MMNDNIIKYLLRSLYPTKPLQYRCLVLGNDASGKTSILYELKLGQFVTTIPTIGFNVETINSSECEFIMWDVGGCDKIRPLWRHYFQNTNAIIYVVDSGDRDRLVSPDPEDTKNIFADSGLRFILEEEELKNAKILIFANKQDLPNCLSVESISVALQLEKLRIENPHQHFHIVGTSAKTGEGLFEGLDWLSKACGQKGSEISPSSSPSNKDVEDKQESSILIEWLEREDLPDDSFLDQLENITLDSWDHYTHLRIAWLYLKRLGRQDGLPKIFQSIKRFIELSPRTKRSTSNRGTTFHETMTYFWVHMVHYAMSATVNINESFKTFLLLNPQLCDGGLCLKYYSKQRMFLDPLARTSVLLPDILPLPSLIPSNILPTPPDGARTITSTKPSNPAPLKSNSITDEAFLIATTESHQLTAWGHPVKLRLIYVLLRAEIKIGARRNVDKILDHLKSIEKSNSHVSLNYFWIQMVSYYIAVVSKGKSKLVHATNLSSSSHTLEEEITFDVFFELKECDKLHNSLLYEEYYSRSIIDSQDSMNSFALPDLKPFPSVL
mmetsp:Transcript_20151/g.28886  ORF Transcript_20151/g.28886 Transcript_20151/m.28886 type:complete len:554 (+) Transcript_20151:48-1709(+)